MNASIRKLLSSIVIRPGRRQLIALLGATVVILLSACSLPPPKTGSTGGVSVIVHPDNDISQLSTGELNKIFTRRTDKWRGGGNVNGTRIQAFDLPAEDPAREIFSRHIYGKSTREVREGWITSGLKGGKRPPAIRPAREVLKMVTNNRTAIGYVPTSMVKGRARILYSF